MHGLHMLRQAKPFLHFHLGEGAADNFPKYRGSGSGAAEPPSLDALNWPWLAAGWGLARWLLRLVNHLSVFDVVWNKVLDIGWWKVSRNMQQQCSGHILQSQVLSLLLVPQDSRATIMSGRRPMPTLNSTRYSAGKMMNNGQLTCLASVCQLG